MIGKHWWKWLALAAAVGLALWYLLHRGSLAGFDWAVFRATIVQLRWTWLALACAFVIGTYYGRALRWAVLMRPLKSRPGMWNLFSATVIGFSAITVLGRPGEFVRPYLISLKERVPLSSQLAAWLLERIYDLLIALAVFGFALGQVRNSGVHVGPALSWVLATGGWFVASISVVVLAILLLIGRFSEKMRQRLLDGLAILPEHHFPKAERLVNAFVQGVESTRSGSAVVLLILYTMLEWVVIVACIYCTMQAFGGVLHFSLTDVLIFLGFVSFGSVIQIPGVGGGMQVVSVLVLTELFRVPVEVATSVAVLVWIITFVVIVPFGLLLAVHEGLNIKKLKEIGREVSA